MAEPPGSPQIKEEPQDTTGVALPFKSGETISLISDDEDEMVAGTRPLGSPFLKRILDPTGIEAIDLGTSMLSSKPKPVKPDLDPSLAATLKEARRKAAEQFQQKPPAQRTPAPVGRSELFVTDSQPGTPDAAEVFRTLQREMERKRLNGTLTWQDDVQFVRAKATEKARVLKARLDEEHDASDDLPSDNDDIHISPDAASLPDYDHDEGEPKKRGRKRTAADSTQAAQPKKRRTATKSTEDILEVARRKMDAKAKTKSTTAKVKTKEKQATTKQGRKKKPTAPDLLNTSTMLGSNVFNDTARMRDMPNQPTFAYQDSHKRKDKALKSLIASIPEEYRPVAKTDSRFLDEAMRDFTGRGAVTPADDGNWNVKGMRVTLKHYQILGAAFMRKRENGTVEPKGGILADSMGMGKTITMLTNIVNGKSLQQSKCHTTLIVASAALISQWRREISEKVFTDKDSKHGIGRVKEYHGSAQLRSNQEVEELMDCDIVLTTYTQVQRSYPKPEVPAEFTTAAQKNEWWKKHYEEEKGPLHRVKWFRVVLDEAQAIKNHKSLTSTSCRALTGKHCWAISGTPLQNGIEEFYSLFKFIKEPHGAGSMKLFRKNFCSSDDEYGLEKLDVFLRKFMIRRTHLDSLFSARLLDIPQPTEKTVWLEFNEIERNVYEIVKARFVKRINCISKAGDLDKQYGHIWTMLLRLRQLTSHIFLVQGTLVDLLEREDFERLYKIASDDLSGESEALLTHLREKLRDSGVDPQVDSRDGAKIVTETETVPNYRNGFESDSHGIGGTHGLTYKFDRYLKDLLNSESWEAVTLRTLCCGCRQPPQDPMVTSCFHIYCHSCLQDSQNSFARRAMDRHRCAECGSYYTEAKRCQASLKKFSGAYDSMTGSNDEEKIGVTGKSKKPNLQSWLNMRGDVLPSAKTIAVKAQVMDWIEEDPTVKIIIYSQWIPMLRLLGRICQTEQWEYEKYTGNMTHDSRDKAIKDFGDPSKEKRILLASLKCGGLGLNLTMSSRVISLDPWWNQAVEQQAFCRVFRIGQQKEAKMARLVVKNTIDAAMVQLAEDKQEAIDMAMDVSKRKERLSVNELMRLFGQVGEDASGKPFIFAHDDEDDDDKDDDSKHCEPPKRAAENASDDEGDGLDDDV